MPSTIADRLDQVRHRINEAALRSGRNPDAVTLLPVTKTVPAERLRELPSLGYTSFGENRVQELRTKSEELAGLDIDWQLIGRLQTNKAGQAARLANVVQSVDSLRLAQSLSRSAEAAGRELSILLQVNTSGEGAKAGFAPAEVPVALEQIAPLPALTVKGFMTMAPFEADEATLRQTFGGLRDLRDRLAPQFEGSGAELHDLSMGMSGDYELAIEEGATIVRVGSAIFGARH